MFTASITRSAFFSMSFLISYDAVSQLTILPKYEAGINVGAYMYQGDLTPRRIGSVETIQPGIAIFGTRILSSTFSVRLQFALARLAADESIYKYPDWRQQRNFSFTASVKELSLSIHWNILGTNYTDVKFEPYIFAGAGLSYISTAQNYSRINLSYFGETSEVQNGILIDAAMPGRKVIPVAPVGAGLRYHISKKIVLNVEAAYRLMHADYLDGFSKAANPGLNDHYSGLTIGAAYKFGTKEKYGCPSVK